MDGLDSAELDTFLRKDGQMLMDANFERHDHVQRAQETPNHVPPLKLILACVDLPPSPNPQPHLDPSFTTLTTHSTQGNHSSLLYKLSFINILSQTVFLSKPNLSHGR